MAEAVRNLMAEYDRQRWRALARWADEAARRMRGAADDLAEQDRVVHEAAGAAIADLSVCGTPIEWVPVAELPDDHPLRSIEWGAFTVVDRDDVRPDVVTDAG